MLQGINRIGKSWVGRVIVAVLFGFLIVSFAVWGIGDIFRGNVRTQVATVGGREITAEAYRNAYQTEYQNLIRRARRPVTPDQARALGLEQRVLGRLVSEAAFDHETTTLGLAIPDALVVRAIQADPAFKGVTGAFDVGRFQDLIRQNGLTEAQYLREQRSVMARQQLAEAVSGAVRVPMPLRETIHRYQGERRSAEIVVLTAASLGDPPKPTEEQLSAFYEERKATFRAPETRALSLLILEPATLAKPDAVGDADARAAYAKLKDTRFGTPEKRSVQQILFPSKVEAEAASERIRSGTPFETIATERGVDDTALNLGTLTRGEMIDPATAEAAFSLPEGGVSAPVEGRFGPALIRVARIEAGNLRPFEEVAGEVKAEIARERARTEVQAVHDAIEDQRAGAKSLAEIAKDKGLALTPVAAIDRAGLDAAGKAVDLIPDRDAVLAAAFRSDVGSDNEAVGLRNGGYVWFDVTGIQPSRDRPLADVKEQAALEWSNAEIARRLAEKARGLADRLDKGESSAALAAELGTTYRTVVDLARGQEKDGVASSVVTRIFATPVGKAASVAPDDLSRVLFKVTGAAMPPFVTSTQESAATEDQLRTLLADDLLAEYIEDIQKRIGVTLYPNNVRRAIGGET